DETDHKETQPKRKRAPSVVERDVGDVGVPMLPGDDAERQGPEDAFGPGEKRGDYSNRVRGDHRQVVPTEEGVEVVDQTARVEQVGDEKGLKGGVETTD